MATMANLETMRECGACHMTKSEDDFSNTQKRKFELGRCRHCIGNQIHFSAEDWKRAMEKNAQEAPIRAAEAVKQAERQRRQRIQWKKEQREREREQEARQKYHRQHPVPPPHPDEGQWKVWKRPEKTLKIESGGFCYGLANEAEKASTVELATFAYLADVSSNKRFRSEDTNTVAKKGTWNAYKILNRSETYGEQEGGWIVCHEDQDPVVEIRRMIFETFEEHYGGDSLADEDGSGNFDRHKEIGMVIVPRYLIGTTYQFSESKGGRVREEGIYLVDYQQAQVSNPKKNWTNAIRGMHSGGDFDIARLAYEDGLCKAFLLWGRCSTFHDAYFEEGSAPLGQNKWPNECFCPHHGFCNRRVSVHEYLKMSETKLCLNPPSRREVHIRLYGWDPDEPGARERHFSKKRKTSAKAAATTKSKSTTTTRKKISSSTDSKATMKRKVVSPSSSSETSSAPTPKVAKITDFFQRVATKKLS